MSGISAKLPLSRDSINGISLHKDYRSSVRQNIIMLLLTVPGERIMIPDFGVGLKTFLFEQDDFALRENIAAKIREQLNIFLPFVDLIDIQFDSSNSNPNMEDNILFIRIEYSIVPLDSIGVLTLEANEQDKTILVQPDDLASIV